MVRLLVKVLGTECVCGQIVPGQATSCNPTHAIKANNLQNWVEITVRILAIDKANVCHYNGINGERLPLQLIICNPLESYCFQQPLNHLPFETSGQEKEF